MESWPSALCPCYGAHPSQPLNPALPSTPLCLACHHPVTTRGIIPQPLCPVPSSHLPVYSPYIPFGGSCIYWLCPQSASSKRMGASEERGSPCSLLIPRTRKRTEPTEHIRNKETNNAHFSPLLSGNSMQPVPWLS